MGRAIACEVIARRIVHNVAPEKLNTLMSTRYRHKEWDGDDSSLSSALELAIDQHCTIFLSSNEAQFGERSSLVVTPLIDAAISCRVPLERCVAYFRPRERPLIKIFRRLGTKER